MIKISIITVCFNSKTYIEQTIKSVLSQSYKHIEYIVIDGGSTDGTIDILGKYKEGIAVLVSEPDQNMYDAINKGMRLATGDYIAILNSDDFYLNKDVVAIVVSEVQKMSIHYKGVYGNLQKFTADGLFIKRRKSVPVKFKTLLCAKKLTFVGHGTLFIDRSAYLEIGDYDCNHFMAAADYDYVLRLFKRFAFKYIDVDIMGFRVHKSSITASGKIIEEVHDVLSKNGYKEIFYIERMFRYYMSWTYFALKNIGNIKLNHLKSFLLKR